MSIRDIVIEEFIALAAEQNVALPPLNDDLQLMDAGLDSLFFAILVSRLEDATGSDPFVTATAAEFPRTLGDLIAFYERVHA